ncbi:efflux RND transporter periplasmic adaptor subunit [Noviherbaspirillum saxi]|uniref:Efflux RND transporter periplasmic adaptor subunit n=1 Tax=Noviherbaspirillum saxi TaxID=2320863 RepID=A0A3A3G1S6_9BURK|nr:efflux RND transporter periplasmic adaptor subunit [Noviherbaspirillum saxi]RJF92023.1 efflux RND transporter periplasmic adaptor subunit [Noviherbaspirillum saxi]
MNRGLIAVALAAVSLGTASGYGLYRVIMTQGEDTSSREAGIGAPEKKVLYWHDPMVPGPRFDKPGKSPFMDMQLVPVYADEAGAAGDDGKVGINPRVQQNLGIRTTEVARKELAPVVSAVGSIAYNERDVVLIQARSNGFVEGLHVRAPLARVHKGQALAELYVPEWIAAQEEYLAARRVGGGTGLNGLAKAARQRMRLAGMSEDQIRTVEARGNVQPHQAVTAPVDGVVTELAAREGMTVAPGMSLFRLNGTGTVWLNADLPENMSVQVRAGTAVEAQVSSMPGMVFKGKVSELLPEIDPATRTRKARIELANASGELTPGMFATVSLASAPRAAVLAVPSEAVIQTGERQVVILMQEGGTFKPVDVQAGIEANGWTEIRKGVEAGQTVVVSGQFLIDSEASLKGTATRMNAVTQATHRTYRTEGKVEDISKEEATISHAPIPALKWGEMTMEFALPAGGMPKGIAVGDKVVFEFSMPKEGVYQITTISRATASGSGGRKAAGAS